MRIVQVDLENVKSYRRQSVTFAEGTNAICGPNGAGKSTILEAIGFALFDFLPYSHGSFVREGEKIATVTVHLLSQDERAYQVVRKCGSGAQYYVYDPEFGKVTTGKEDTVAWLCEQLAVEGLENLTALFRDAVGVPQGLLTAVFLETPAKRKPTFDPLLRVDEYKQVWDALLEPRRHLEQQIAAGELRMARFEAEVRALPECRAKAARLKAEVDAGEGRQSTLQAELEAVAGRKRRLELVKARLDELDQALAQARASVETLEARLADAQAAVERAEKAQAVVRGSEAGYRAYQAAQANLEALELQRQERDELDKLLQQHVTDLALARQQSEALQADLGAVARAEGTMVRLKPQVETQERVERDLADARRNADRLRDLKGTLEQGRNRLGDLEARLSKVKEGLAELADVDGEIASRRTELAGWDDQRNTLTARMSGHEAELTQLRDQGRRAVKRVADAEQKLEQEQARLTKLETSLAKVEADLEERARAERGIEALRTDLEALEAQYADLTVQAAACQAALDQVRSQTDILETIESPECPVCRAPLSPEHRAELLSQNQARQEELETALAGTTSGLTETDQVRKRNQRTLRELEKRVQELPRLAEVDPLRTQIAAQREAVAQSEASLAVEQADANANRTRQAAVEATLNGLQTRHEEIDAARRKLQQALDRLEKRRSKLPRPDEADDLSARRKAEGENVQMLEASVTELAAAPAEVERFAAELEALGDPRRECQRAADIADRRSTVEGHLVVTEQRIADLNGQIQAVGESLAPYDGLDGRIGAEQATLSAHEANHRRYLEHIREAEALSERQAKAKELAEQLETQRADAERLALERGQVAAGYDPQAYADLASSYEALRDELAALGERLRQQRGQLKEALAEALRLTGVAHQLDAACAEHGELTEVLALLSHIRQVLRDAGPEVTKALVARIGLQAARLYADIMADHTSRLQWAEDYEILLTTSGRERSFQQLSGGEQMAAALAVRLALLQEVSDIDIAFFDEPTANLDDHRRDNLAEQLLNIKGRFSQLFVISHDDTFERDTDQVVRVIKEGGVSRVEV